MSKGRGLSVWALPFIGCALIACAGPVSAALTVEIAQPDTDPFTSKVNNPAHFAAVAYLNGQELPVAEVTWDFGDQTAHSTDNPTTHTFTQVGEYTVTVTASHGGQQARDSVVANVQEAGLSPATGSISMYVAHDGTWLNYRIQEYEEAEIEDFVAVFTPPERITDDPDVWAAHQINDPQIPAGWLFFEAASPTELRVAQVPAGWPFFKRASPMQLHIVIRDTRNRLGQVVVTDRYTQHLVGMLDANVLGSEIDGRIPVDPRVEALNLNVKDAEGATLILAGADDPQLHDGVVVMHTYVWEPNRGDEHAGCPADREPPWGNPADARGKKSQDDGTPPVWRRACCGREEFDNDKQVAGVERAQYVLHDKDRLWDQTHLVLDLVPAAARAVVDKIEAAQALFPIGGPFIPELYEVPPFSRGVVHFLVDVQGQVASVVYVAYRSKAATKSVVAPLIEARISEATPAGGNSSDPARSWAAGITFTPTEVKRWRVVGGGRSAGNVWGLFARNATTELERISGITAPVTFALTTDIPGGPISGTGSAEVDTAWTTAPPPGAMDRPVELTFGQEGTCTVDLAKGWKWKAKGQPNMHYSEGTVGLFHAPRPGTVTLKCHLQVLIALKVKTTDPDNQPAQAQVEVYQRDGANWVVHSNGDTVEMAREQVFIDQIPLSPGTYKIRAKAKFGPNPPWVEGRLFAVTSGTELIKSIQVEPGEVQP